MLQRRPMLNKILILFLSIGISFLTGCVTVPKETEAPLQYTFKYQVPPPRAKVQNLRIGIIGRPKTALVIEGEAIPQKNVSEIDNIKDSFIKAFVTDAQEILIKKGATVENFPIYDDLTFIKKEETTLVLLLELSGKIISKNIQSRAISDKNMMLDSIVSSLAQSGGSREYKEIDCKIVPQNFQIVLNIIEPLTEQKLWAKRVEINESAARDCKYKVKIDNRNKTLEFFSDERLKIIAALLEQVYPEIMKKIDAYLDPVELKSIQEKALKLKKLKRF